MMVCVLRLMVDGRLEGRGPLGEGTMCPEPSGRGMALALGKPCSTSAWGVLGRVGTESWAWEDRDGTEAIMRDWCRWTIMSLWKLIRRLKAALRRPSQTKRKARRPSMSRAPMTPPAIAGRFGPDLIALTGELGLEDVRCEPAELDEVGDAVFDGALVAVEVNDAVPVGAGRGTWAVVGAESGIPAKADT